MFLSLSNSIESQLRDAYTLRFETGRETLTSLGVKIGVNKSVISRKLNGHTNMTIESISDLIWALDFCIDVNIFEPSGNSNRNRFTSDQEEDAILSYDEELDDFDLIPELEDMDLEIEAESFEPA